MSSKQVDISSKVVTRRSEKKANRFSSDSTIEQALRQTYLLFHTLATLLIFCTLADFTFFVLLVRWPQ